MKYIQYVLAAILVLAALSKLVDLGAFRDELEAYQMIGPVARSWLTLIVPAAELSVGMLGLWCAASIPLARSYALLFGVFLCVNIYRIFQGGGEECSCVSTNIPMLNSLFGGNHVIVLVRSIALAALATVMLIKVARHRSEAA